MSSEARIDPPIQVEYNRSCGAEIYQHPSTFFYRVLTIRKINYTLICTSLGDNFLISDNSRSPNPLNNVEPPDNTMFL